MKPQMLYKGDSSKKEKPTKMEKVYDAVQKVKRRAAAQKKKATS